MTVPATTIEPVLFKKIETYLKYNVNAPMFMKLLLENLIFFYLKINYLGEKIIF